MDDDIDNCFYNIFIYLNSKKTHKCLARDLVYKTDKREHVECTSELGKWIKIYWYL